MAAMSAHKVGPDQLFHLFQISLPSARLLMIVLDGKFAEI